MPVASRRALAAIAVAQLLALTLWFSASAVSPQLESLWGLTTGQATWLTLAVQLGFVVGALFLALTGLPDMVSSRAVFVVSALVGAGVNLGLLALGPGDHPVAVTLRFVTGMALAGVYPSGLKVMSGWFDRSRGAALGILVGALTVGSAAPNLIKGLGFGWQGVVTGSSILAVIGAVVVGLVVSDGPYEVPTRRFSWSHVGSIVANRGFRLSTYGYLGHMWELYAMWAWTAGFLTASAAASGHDRAFVPTATFFIIAVGGVGAWRFGVWADRSGRARAAGVSMVMSGSVALVTPLVFGASPVLVVGVFLIWGYFVVADSAQFSALVTETASEAERGTALTLQTALGFLLTLVTIRLVPVLADAWGWRWSLVVLSIGPAFGVWAMVRLQRWSDS